MNGPRILRDRRKGNSLTQVFNGAFRHSYFTMPQLTIASDGLYFSITYLLKQESCNFKCHLLSFEHGDIIQGVRRS